MYKCIKIIMCTHTHTYMHTHTHILYRLIGLVGRVFANGPGDLGSIPGHEDFKNGTWYLLA